MQNKYEGMNFETALPEGYTLAKTVDATTKSFTLWMNLAALVPVLLGAAAVVVLLVRAEVGQAALMQSNALLIYAGALLLYIVAHELTHGIAYYGLTRHKLTFGFKATVAYCGVPDIFVYRKAALISLLAPFVVFSVVFLALTALSTDIIHKCVWLLVFATHFGGCVGDLYDTYLYLTRFRDPTTLMQDTGPKQDFYQKQA